MSSLPKTAGRRFRLTLHQDSQAVIRALGPFAVAGLVPQRMTVEAMDGCLRMDAEFQGLDISDADWLCNRLLGLPVVRWAEHRAVASHD